MASIKTGMDPKALASTASTPVADESKTKRFSRGRGSEISTKSAGNECAERFGRRVFDAKGKANRSSSIGGKQAKQGSRKKKGASAF